MITAKSYPYPVLGSADDIEGVFNPSFHVTLSPEVVLVEYSIDLRNETIETLLSQGIVVYAIQVECKSTFFRKTFTSSKNIGNFEIPSQRLREKVTVSFNICAVHSIPNYQPKGCHPDYSGLAFSIEKGDILADGGEGTFIAEKSFDPLSAPVSSFMKIQPASYSNGPMQVDAENDDIIIRLSKDDYDKFLALKDIDTANLHASVVFPALVDVLHSMNTNKDSSIESYSWYMRLTEICRVRKIDIEDELNAAQTLLGNPLERNFIDQMRILEEQ